MLLVFPIGTTIPASTNFFKYLQAVAADLPVKDSTSLGDISLLSAKKSIRHSIFLRSFRFDLRNSVIKSFGVYFLHLYTRYGNNCLIQIPFSHMIESMIFFNNFGYIIDSVSMY